MNKLMFLILVFYFLYSSVSEAVWALNENEEGGCYTPDQELGQCVGIRKCPKLFIRMQQQQSNADAHYIRQSVCGFEGHDPKVCCACSGEGAILGDALAMTACKEQTEVDIRVSVTTVTIVGGQPANIGEFPWMAVLEYTTNSGRQFACGGSLINNRYVLTAAHCIKYSLISVRLGEHDTSKTNDCGFCEDSIDVGIAEKIPHEGYVGYTRQNDIGLLRLAKEVNFTSFIKPILLPKSRNLSKRIYQGTTMTVAGWGLTENGTSSDILRKLNVFAGEVWDCELLYVGKTKIPSALICAGGENGKDSCIGDSGGPLMLEEDDNIYAIGIISFGSSQCGLQNWPAVHTKVSYYIEWIYNNLKP